MMGLSAMGVCAKTTDSPVVYEENLGFFISASLQKAFPPADTLLRWLLPIKYLASIAHYFPQ